jgi:hypothetical protein
MAAVFWATVMLGFSEVNGLCGVSHMGSLTPLRALGMQAWVKAVLAYTLCGIATASIVGACLALLGLPLGLSLDKTAYVVIPLSLLLAARELGWIDFRLPQIRKQTRKMWAMEYGFTTGAAMWGAHIGFAFFTVVKHGGLYVLAVLAISLEPLLASALFATYWVGRTLPIWIVPIITDRRVQKNGAKVSELVLESSQVLRHLAAAALLCTTCAIALRVFGP